MKHLKRYTIIGIIFVLITGTFAHFLYDWTENNHIVGFFTPINESIWEHMKLLFFPMLIYSVFIIFICFVLFTYHPPKTNLFSADVSKSISSFNNIK